MPPVLDAMEGGTPKKGADGDVFEDPTLAKEKGANPDGEIKTKNFGKVKAGDVIAGYEVVRVRPGTNGKVAIIGRKMAIVEKVAAELEANNEIELFNERYQNNIDAEFNIDGVVKDWDGISKDFADKTRYMPRDENGYITLKNLPNTDMYKANEQWADKLHKEGYEVIDLGNPEGAEKSEFFDMEQGKIFGD